MTDTAAPAAATPNGPARRQKPEKPGFAFTDPGCRTEVRLGALLMLAAVFLWHFVGPRWMTWLYLGAAPLLLVGMPLQVLAARRGEPGFPWKLGLAMAIGGALMIPDLRYRERVDGPVDVQPIGQLLLAAGAYILVWWPFARRRVAKGQA